MKQRSIWGWAAIILIICLVGWWGYKQVTKTNLPDDIAQGNGRIEATEIDISAKLAGRIEDILVREGDLVEPGQVLVEMDVSTLNAQLRQAQAQLRQAEIGIKTAQMQVEQSKAEQEAAEATLAQTEIVSHNAKLRTERSTTLQQRGTVSTQTRDDDQANYDATVANVAAAKAKVAAAKAAVSASQANVVNAEAQVDAAKASIERIQSDIDDSSLKATRLGRVQYRIAQPGEVTAAGGRVLNMVDLSDIYMTFFLPTEQVGKVSIGSEARIVLDAAPDLIIPANISFISDVAQFTPKTVETAEERAKLMFRIRAGIPRELLLEHLEMIKTGLPGVVYVKLSPNAQWPEFLNDPVVIQKANE